MSSCRPWNVGTLQEKDKAEKCIPVYETIPKSYMFSSMKRKKNIIITFSLSNLTQWNQSCDISCSKAAWKSILGHRSPHHKQRLHIWAAATGSTPVCFHFVPAAVAHYRLCKIKPAKCLSKSKRKQRGWTKARICSAHLLCLSLFPLIFHTLLQ